MAGGSSPAILILRATLDPRSDVSQVAGRPWFKGNSSQGKLNPRGGLQKQFNQPTDKGSSCSWILAAQLQTIPARRKYFLFMSLFIFQI